MIHHKKVHKDVNGGIRMMDLQQKANRATVTLQEEIKPTTKLNAY